jgi:hypothetical protein
MLQHQTFKKYLDKYLDLNAIIYAYVKFKEYALPYMKMTIVLFERHDYPSIHRLKFEVIFADISVS